MANVLEQAPDEATLRAAFAGGVYFISPEELLSHNSGCLMEGLRALGLRAQANTARVTSRQASQPLLGVAEAEIRTEPFAGMSAVLIDISHGNRFVPLDSMKGGRLGYVNNSDVSIFCTVPEPFPLFSVHETRRAKNGARRFPLAFGPSTALIAASERRQSFSKRKRVALRNFRATLSQGVRALLDMTYVPHVKSHMTVDENILAPADYVAALQGAQVCLAYGGEFFSAIQTNPWFAANDPATLVRHSFERLDAPAFIMRWDSWRFWESLVCGCLTVHLDFDKYGFDLPVMPKPWVHYVPIDLDDLKGSVAALMDREKIWGEIAEAGRAWAIEHYAPRPTALRVLRQML
ncbi:MAG: hypothetical protein SFV19_14320 [Rhodospirillaceae bacterium]|nr:hypothetical protein [Rhodospirillaceae bacterium]